MTSIRLLLTTFCLSISFNSCILLPQHMIDHVNSKKSSDFSDQWSKILITELSPAELQLAINILYLLYANALIDIKIRQFIIPITRLNQTIRSNILTYNTTTKEVTTLKTLLDRLSFVMGARTIYNQMLKTCLDYYNNHQSPALTQKIIELQTYGQRTLNEVATMHTNELSDVLTMASKVFTDGIEPLTNLSKMYEAIANGSLTETLQANNSTKEFAHLIVIDELLKSNAAATQNNEYILNTIDNSTETLLQLMSSATDIYKEHYAALYTHISSDSFEKTYASTLFDMYDLLPHEYRSLLPHPDEVFEHVLRTIKLYTQTEYIQN